jgi:aspartyl-tRNA(Asn)/glutamyl-tRNA(Gln) amidotransferase subunit A
VLNDDEGVMVDSKAKDLAAMQVSLQATALRLHSIESRSSTEQIAAEVLRLNDAVRAGAAGRLHYGDHPQDFAKALLLHADPSNGKVN